MSKLLYGSVIITYRCNAHCNMCDCWKYPTKVQEEISLETIEKLPKMSFTNVTGGEPFVRTDIEKIIEILYRKTDRIVISTNGFFKDRILALCKKYPDIGIRISIEGLEKTNDEIRGIPDGFKIGYETLKTLVEQGHKDVGFGMTVQDINAEDLIPLYNLSCELGMEFATATLHNSFYFKKKDNKIKNKSKVVENFELLINKMLKSKHPKEWFRAYFNHGLINYIYGNDRLLPCEMGADGFFIDPFSNILPCNGSDEPMIMGNLNKQSWDEIWFSQKAKDIREKVRTCPKNCWMIGSVAPAMKKRIYKPILWIGKNKILGHYSYNNESKENKLEK